MSAGATSQGAALAQRLREETRAIHERIETAASFNRLVVVAIPQDTEPAELERARAEYREVLWLFLVAAYGFETAVDERLRTSPAVTEALSSGWRPEATNPVGRIADDVRTLWGERAVAVLRPADGLPPVRSLGAFAGMEYVRRGSRAGGAVIAHTVQRNLGLDADHGASFLGQYGRRTRAVLDELRGWLDGLPLDAAEQRAAVRTARATFEAVGRSHLRLETQPPRRPGA